MPKRRSSSSDIALQRCGLPTRTGTMWLSAGMTGNPASSRRRLTCGGALLVAVTFDAARPEVTDAGQGAGGESRRQRRRVDEAGRAAPEEVDQRCRPGDISADNAN